MDFIEKFYHPDFDGRQIGDLKLCYCGRRTGAPDHRFGPAARENYWFIYLKEGSGIYTVGGVTRRLKKGCVFAAFPMRRIFYKADPGSVWSIYWVSIAADNLDGYLESTGITEDNPVIEVESPGAIESIFESLLMTILTDNAGDSRTRLCRRGDILHDQQLRSSDNSGGDRGETQPRPLIFLEAVPQQDGDVPDRLAARLQTVEGKGSHARDRPENR